jgi:hypothetical protein
MTSAIPPSKFKIIKTGTQSCAPGCGLMPLYHRDVNFQSSKSPTTGISKSARQSVGDVFVTRDATKKVQNHQQWYSISAQNTALYDTRCHYQSSKVITNRPEFVQAC